MKGQSSSGDVQNQQAFGVGFNPGSAVRPSPMYRAEMPSAHHYMAKGTNLSYLDINGNVVVGGGDSQDYSP